MSMRSLIPDMTPPDPDVLTAKAGRVRLVRQVVIVMGLAVAVVATLLIGGRDRPDAVPVAPGVTTGYVTPTTELGACPSLYSLPPGQGRSADATGPVIVWAGREYFVSPTRTADEPSGEPLFWVSCELPVILGLQEITRPWPDGSAAGYPVGTPVYLPDGAIDQCVLVVFSNGWQAFEPDEGAAGC